MICTPFTGHPVGGAVSYTHLDVYKRQRGTTVTITVKPDEGYELDKLTVTGKDGESIKLTDKGDGKYTFKMPASKVEVEAVFTAIETEPEQPESCLLYTSRCV